jgi:hypothetical protein
MFLEHCQAKKPHLLSQLCIKFSRKIRAKRSEEVTSGHAAKAGATFYCGQFLLETALVQEQRDGARDEL